MSIWDKHSKFLAKDAALLATESGIEAEGLIKLMHQAYENARKNVSSKYLFLFSSVKVELRGGDGKLIQLPYQSVDDPLPDEGFYSDDLMGHINEIFDLNSDPDWRLAMTECYEGWNERKGDDPTSAPHCFEVQMFTRKEIARWLQLNEIKSIYPFSLKAQLNTKKASKSTAGKDSSDPNNEANNDTEWISIARRYANEFIIEKATKNSYPSQNDIGDHVAKRFRNEGINAAHGKPPTGSYIKRKALKGIRAQ